MPYKIDYLESTGGVITTYWGELTEEEFVECTEAKFVSLDKYSHYRYSISDLSAVTRLAVSIDTLKSNALMSGYALDSNESGYMAVVVSSDLLYGISRQWKANTGNLDDRVGIFRTRDEADEWIAEKLARTFKVIVSEAN
jgi:hypothetical protein